MKMSIITPWNDQKILKEHFFLPSQPHYRTTKKNLSKKKSKKITKYAKHSPKMPPKEPIWHENEPNDPLKRPEMLKEHLFLPSQSHYSLFDQEKLNQEKRQKNPQIHQKKSKMPLTEPKWHDNEPTDPLKRPNMLKEHFFCPRSHILGRMTKTNQPRKKPKETQNTPIKVQKCPQKSQNGMQMSLTYRKRRNIIFFALLATLQNL